MLELWITDSTLNESTNSLINEQIGAGLMAHHAYIMAHGIILTKCLKVTISLNF